MMVVTVVPMVAGGLRGRDRASQQSEHSGGA
jgi:hypothetical protein